MEENNWLGTAYLDLCSFRLKFQYYPNKEYMSEERIWSWWLET